ncbi:MAG TPA: hypothetical protein EYP85_13575 [Armatimonadetes bacterium]|nr:hypothetical protein [Armatimonadota bacterium]
MMNIGSRRELFVDDWLSERMEGVELRLHHPTPREVVIAFDQPWEGNTCAYVSVFQDGDRFRMYYRGSNHDLKTGKETHPSFTCYAESRDGIHWTRPELNLFEFEGSKRNNIVWQGVGSHNFTPFKDANPACPPEARYKALGVGKGGLYAFQSPDGIHWSLLRPQPVITKGAFDSQNLAFWDSVRGHYVEFHRGFREGFRDIMTSTSEDFIQWTEPQWLDYGDAPREHLYTNAIRPYFRAPHLFLGFPKRFLPPRRKTPHPIAGLSDGVFMTSRDGLHWHRWLEAFIRPGPQPERWINRNNMTAWGIVVTKSSLPGAPDELSLYSSEAYYTDGNRLRRFTLRLDGFVSLHADYAGGELVTKPLTFEGRELVINYATSAAGSIRVELQDAAGQPLPGYRLEEAIEIYGDELERVVSWKNGSDVSPLAGRPIRLRFVLKDADLYAMRFRP